MITTLSLLLTGLTALTALTAPAQAADVVTSWSFDVDDGGFAPTSGFQWEWGTPSGQGPGSAFLGAGVWATRLDGLYLNEVPDGLRFPAVDLTGLAQPTVSWWQWLEVDDGDQARLELLTDGSWDIIAPIYGDAVSFESAPEWVEVFVDLSGVDDLSDLRLFFAPDTSVQAPGWYLDEVTLYDGDAAPPGLSELTLLDDTQDVAGPYIVSVLAVDDTAIAEISLQVRFDDSSPQTVAMVDVGGGLYEGSIPGQAPDTTITYTVLASDGDNAVEMPKVAHAFRVFLPAPTGLEGPDGRVVGQSAWLSWDAPVSTNGDAVVDSYRVWRVTEDGEELVAEVSDAIAETPLDPTDNTYAVSAVFDVDGDFWEGDLSEIITVNAAWSEIAAISPASAFQGDAARVEITGQNLLLVGGEVGLDFGEGVTPLTIEVRDVDSAVVTLEVSEDAAVGLRDVVLSSGSVDLTVVDGFEVLDGADRPRLLSVQPSSVTQGEELRLTLSTAGDIGDVLSLDPGEGLLVESLEKGEDGTLIACIVVDPSAGIGDRSLVVDDGLRLLTGATLTVERRVFTVDSGCGAPLPVSWLWLLGAGALLRRRE